MQNLEHLSRDDLLKRINECMVRMGKMCSEGRPPRMSVPVRPDDDDVFIDDALREVWRRLAGGGGLAGDAPGGGDR